MTSYTTTIATSGNTFALAPTTADYKDKPKTPSGLIATQAVQTIDGWLGQVIVDKTIVFQTDPLDYSEAAVDAANQRVVTAVKGLFLQPQAELEA